MASRPIQQYTLQYSAHRFVNYRGKLVMVKREGQGHILMRLSVLYKMSQVCVSTMICAEVMAKQKSELFSCFYCHGKHSTPFPSKIVD